MNAMGITITANGGAWLIIVIVLITLTLGIIIGTQIRRKKDRQNPMVVIARLRKISQWATASATVNTIYQHESHGNTWRPWRWLVNDKLLLVAYGEFVAGINLQNITREDVTITGASANVISIRLPHPEILTPSGNGLNEEQTYVYARSSGIFSPKKDTETQARRAALQSLREKAASGGLLQEAADSVYLQLEALLKAMGYTEINISIAGGTYKTFFGKTKVLPDRLLSPPAKKRA